MSKASVPSIYAPADEINARLSIGKARRIGTNGAFVFSTNG